MRSFLVIFLTACSLLFTIPLPSAENQSKRIEGEIEQVLRAQQEAWNAHNLEGFMAGYWNSPRLTFFAGDQIASGWDAALARYRRTYQGKGKEMGKLEFSDLRIEPLGSEAAFVRGAWHLSMSGGKTPHGLFTLVFRRFPSGWKIIHDHTSTADYRVESGTSPGAAGSAFRY